MTAYTDDTGRNWAVLVPHGEKDGAAMGIPVGPPDTSELGLPDDVAIRLHNELFRRQLFSRRDVNRRPGELMAALQAAYRVDVAAVMGLYR